MNSIEMRSKNFESVEKIVVTFHGYGTSGADFAEVGELLLVHKIDNAIFAFPDAPHMCSRPNFGIQGFEWFPLKNEITKEDVRNGLDMAAPVVAKYLESLKCKYGCSELVVMGFSQGAMMALEMMYHVEVSKIVAFSGLFEENPTKLLAARPNIYIVHSMDDDVVPFKNAEKSKDMLERMRLQTMMFIENDIGHSISENGWSAAIRFIKDEEEV